MGYHEQRISSACYSSECDIWWWLQVIPGQIPLQAWSSSYDFDLCDLARFLLYSSIWYARVHACYDFFASDDGALQEVRLPP